MNIMIIRTYNDTLHIWKRVNEEIMKMTEGENSFEKVAEELNITVEKVQYYWQYWMNKPENEPLTLSTDHSDLQDVNSSKIEPLENQRPQLKGEMQAKLVSPRKVIFFWDSSDLPKQLFQHYFNINFDDLVQMIRIYDVTQIKFNGKNAHHFYDIPVPYQNGYWCVKGLFSNRSYLAEIGVKLSGGSFFPLLRSNSISIPKLDMVGNQDIYQDIIQLYQYEEQPPKWREYVSTYSYYIENSLDGGEK